MKYKTEDGINVCKMLEPILNKLDCHVGLLGSLVYKGYSDKDIDIAIYSRVIYQKINIVNLVRVLSDAGVIFDPDNSSNSSSPGLIRAEILGFNVDLFIMDKIEIDPPFNPFNR